MKYNPNIHHRRSIRLKGYDYSQAGLYFITICCQDRAHLFGEIRRGEPTCSPDNINSSPNNINSSPHNEDIPKMILNDAGKMVEHWYYELENKFKDIKCREMVIMPNHFHCVIENVGTTVEADLRVCPDDKSDKSDLSGEHNVSGDAQILGEHIGSPLHRVVQWFKTMTTNHYIRGVKQNEWERFNGKLWQRNYWEHIIRNDDDYNRIAQYIINNPKNWEKDKLR